MRAESLLLDARRAPTPKMVCIADPSRISSGGKGEFTSFFGEMHLSVGAVLVEQRLVEELREAVHRA